MFNFKYNVIVAFGVVVSALNLLLLAKIYGSTSESDVYFVSMAIYTFITLFLHSFIEQFQIKLRRCSNSPDISVAYMTEFLIYTALIGVIIALTLSFFSNMFVHLFFSGNLTNGVFSEISQATSTLFVALYFYLPLHVLLMSLSANSRIGLYNMILIVPNIFSFSALNYSFFIEKMTISDVIFYFVVGVFCSLVISAIFVWIKIGYTLRFKSKMIKSTIVESLKMKNSHNIHSLFLSWALPYYLSSYPPGILSIFFYAKRLSDLWLSVLYIPTHLILINKMVDFMKTNDFGSILLTLKKLKIIFPLSFTLAFLFTYFILPPINSFMEVLEPANIDVILQLSFFLFLANILITLEVGYGIVNQIKVSYGTVIIANVGFIVLMLGSYLILKEFYGVYALAISILIGQTSNLYVNKMKFKKIMSES